MNKLITISVIALVVMISVAFVSSTPEMREDTTSKITKLEFPADVQTVLDKSCTMCHNSKSKNTKGKMKLNFDKMTNGDYSVGKIGSKLRGIVKTLGKNAMPPKKFLSKNPDKGISAEESKLLIDWATAQSKALTEGK